MQQMDETALYAVALHEDAFDHCIEEARQNCKDFVIRAIRARRSTYRSLVSGGNPLVHDRDVVVEALQDPNGYTVSLVPSALLHDRGIALDAVRKRGMCLQWNRFYLAHASDFEVLHAAVTQAGKALRHIKRPNNLSAEEYRKLALAAVAQDGYAYTYVTIYDDREIALTAVTQAGGALEFVLEPLRSDKAISRAAVVSDPYAIQFVAPFMKDDVDLRLLASKTVQEAFRRFVDGRKWWKNRTWGNEEEYEAFLRAAEEVTHRFPPSEAADKLFDGVQSLLREAMHPQSGVLGKRDRDAYERDSVPLDAAQAASL